MPLNLDPKLVASVVGALLARGALALGVSDDETVEVLIPLLAALVAGYFTPNDGTVLRTEQESGNAKEPVPVTVRKPTERKRKP